LPHPGDEDLLIGYLGLAHGQGFRSRADALISLFRGVSQRIKSIPHEHT
jgi:hypothetical protein